MYYSTITNKELQYFHNRPVHNFTVKLSQILTSPLFKVEEIITDSIYKIFPLFYTNEITSSNSNDKILENKYIICQKTENETFLTFISDETAEIIDYSEYGTYFDIDDKLTESEFNAYISLLRQNVRHTGSFRIRQGEIQGSYGTYEFDLDDTTLIDNGIIISDETITAEPKVKLTNNVFRWSSYILKLDIIHYTGVNILDGVEPTDFKVVDTIEIELTPNTWVDIPVESLEQDYIISLDATVEIRHDKPEIHIISGLKVNATPQTIQTGGTTDITAELLDIDGLHYDVTDGVGKTVYFFERLTPTFTLTATPNPIQTGDTSDIYASVKDSDGSIPKNTKVYFFKQTDEEYIYFNDGTTLTGIVTPSNASSSIVTEGIKYTTSSTGEKNIYYDVPLTSNDNFEFECEIAKIGVSQSIAMYIRNSTTATGCWFSYEDSTGKFGGGCTGSNFSNVDVGALAVGDKIKITYVNGVLSIYKNTSLIYTKSTTFSGTFYIGHYTNNGREQYVKNIKIKYLGDG